MFGSLNPNAYIVEGAVRDTLMGLRPKDLDYVIEATEEQFTAAFPHLTETRVGNNFPVYIINGCEVALTRTERSTGPLYQDFDFTAGVPLADDLGRRDFTINSMALPVGKACVPENIVDPHGGLEDLKNRIIRCINPRAFEEDPLRMIRAARMLSRYPDFRIDIDTLSKIMESAHLIKHVKPERIEAELQKMYEQTAKPSEFFCRLESVGLLEHIMPEVSALRQVPAGPVEYHGHLTAFGHTMDAIDRCKSYDLSFTVFVAVLCHDLGKAVTPKEELPHHYKHEVVGEEICRKLLSRSRFSYHANKLALLVTRQHMRMQRLPEMRPFKQVAFLRSIRREMLGDFVTACHCDHPLTSEHFDIVARVLAAVSVTTVTIPEKLKDRGKEVITEYVNKEYTKTFVALQCNAEETA